jgi:hypothetical protein
MRIIAADALMAVDVETAGDVIGVIVGGRLAAMKRATGKVAKSGLSL